MKKSASMTSPCPVERTRRLAADPCLQISINIWWGRSTHGYKECDILFLPLLSRTPASATRIHPHRILLNVFSRKHNFIHITIPLKETTEWVSAGEGRRPPSANSVCSQFITWHIGFLSKLISVTHLKLVKFSISHRHTNTPALSLSGPCTNVLSPFLLNISMHAHEHARTHIVYRTSRMDNGQSYQTDKCCNDGRIASIVKWQNTYW